MKKIIMALAASAAVLMSGSIASAQDKMKACFIYVGPIGDFCMASAP